MEKPVQNSTDAEYTNLLASRMDEIMHFIAKSYAKGLFQDELSVNQFGILKELSVNGDVPMSHLANGLEVTAPAITTMVDKLEKDGYVKRNRDGKDRRIINISLTKKGKEVIDRIKISRQEFLSYVLSKMTVEEKNTWINTYDKIVVLLRQRAEEAKKKEESVK
jgi:MarR family transcriptional regulator, 2-MHQ and catechol-resistance regulon repressor